MVSTNIDNDFNFMMICALRYALGRRTYAVSMVCDYISDIIPFLDKESLTVMQRDIEGHDDSLEDFCDTVCWTKLRREIIEAIERRDRQ